MSVDELDVRVLTTESGASPFEDWYKKLRNTEARAIIATRLGRIRRGNFGNTRSLRDGVHELKIDFGPGYRIYYSRVGSIIVVLLCGGDKKTQDDDISFAVTLWKDNKDNAERFARRIE